MRDGKPIERAAAGHTIQTGIEYALWIPGLVAPYEEHDARIGAGYTLPAWRALDAQDRALEIAHYRIRRLVSLHSSDAQSEAMEHEARKARR